MNKVVGKITFYIFKMFKGSYSYFNGVFPFFPPGVVDTENEMGNGASSDYSYSNLLH